MNWKRKYFFDILIMLLIILLSFLPYVHLLISEGTKNFTIGSYVFTINDFIDVQTALYFLLMNVSTLCFFVIWFITCSHRWRYFLLIPIIDYLFWTKLDFYDCFGMPQSRGVMHFIPFLLFFLLVLFLIEKKIKGENEEYSLKGKSIKAIFINYFNQKKEYSGLEQLLKHIDELRAKKNKRKYLLTLFYFLSIDSNTGSNIGYAKEKQPKAYFLSLSMSVFLIMIPVLKRIHKLIPHEESVNLGWLIIKENGFGYVDVLIYFFLWKLVLVLVMVFWYVTNKNWWRIVLLIPLIIYSYQFYVVTFGTSKEIDEVEYINSLPLVLIVMGIAMFLSKLFGYDMKINTVKDYLNLEMEKTTMEIAIENIKKMKITKKY